MRRHPHVFGDAEARPPGRVRESWEQSKRDQEGRAGIFHDVPDALPALLYARKVQRRAAAVGVRVPGHSPARSADLDDELRELKEALAEAGEIPRRRRSRPRTCSRSSATCSSPRSTSRAV